MKSVINWFERWMLKRTWRKLVYKNQEKECFKIMMDESRDVHYEDNIPTAAHFMQEQLSKAVEELIEEAQRRYSISNLQTEISKCKFSSEVEVCRIQKEIDSLKSNE